MKNSVLKSGLLFCFVLLFQHVRAELPPAQRLWDDHQASQITVEENLFKDQILLETQLVAKLLKLDHQAQQDRELHLRLWTHSVLRRIDNLEGNWLAILEDPYKVPDSIQHLFLATETAWGNLQSTAVEAILENRKNTLENLKNLQIRLVQEDRIEEAVIAKDVREKLEQSTFGEKLHEKIIKLTPKEFQKIIQKLKGKELASLGNEGPIPPPNALFPFQADNPTFQAYLKAVKVESAGFFATASAHIQIGHHSVYSGLRGLAMVAYYNGEILLEDTFDTYVNQSESIRLSKEIGNLAYGTFVVLAVRDEATRRFTGSTQSSLYRLGAKKGILNNSYRSSYSLIGMKGLEMGGAIELQDMKKVRYGFSSE